MSRYRCNACRDGGELIIIDDRAIIYPRCGSAEVAVFLDRNDRADIVATLRGLLRAKRENHDRKN